MKQKINTFYILNLLSVVEGEILESAHVDISKYIYLDISTAEGQNVIINDLLKPQLLRFSLENQEKIRISMLYCIENYDERKLESILNFYSGSVFLTPNNNITYKQIFEIFYIGVFLKNINNEELNNFIFFEDDNLECWNLFNK